MARPRSFDEDQVLAGAVALFRERGFDGTSVPELTSRLGICRQSLYNCFGDKRGLYLKALERWGQREVDARLELLSVGEAPLDSLRAVVRGFAAMATHCPSDGCMTISGMVENRDDPEALAIVEGQVERLERGFTEALERARAQGELGPEARPQRLARALIAGCYGVGLLSHLPGSGPRIADAVAALLGLLDNAAAR